MEKIVRSRVWINCHNKKFIKKAHNEKKPHELIWLIIFNVFPRGLVSYIHLMRKYLFEFVTRISPVWTILVVGLSPPRASVIRICGQIYHNTYALHPNEGYLRKFSQLYIIDHDSLYPSLSLSLFSLTLSLFLARPPSLPLPQHVLKSVSRTLTRA